ncbi:hypothetical protein [uncultured Ruminobacter sp.]|jgi:hypothetical protein|uniref:hypothetical protein n=1 Tax=Ruminobacter sp. TaxID=2774296 RepID=UPI0025E519ED|nr:hypothetical protein [uncultured Ruminobacter sp.]
MTKLSKLLSSVSAFLILASAEVLALPPGYMELPSGVPSSEVKVLTSNKGAQVMVIMSPIKKDIQEIDEAQIQETKNKIKCNNYETGSDRKSFKGTGCTDPSTGAELSFIVKLTGGKFIMVLHNDVVTDSDVQAIIDEYAG